MNARIIPPAAAIVAIASAAAAQIPAATGESTLGVETMQPVIDRPILAHAIFNQLEGRFNGSNTEFRWDGQGWVGTDYQKLWIKSEGTFSNDALEDGQQQFLYDRAVTTYFALQGGLRSDIDSRPTRNWGSFGIQGLISSISRSPALRAARATSPPSWRPLTTFFSPNALSCSRK